MSPKLMSCLAGLALAGLIIFSQIALAESVIEKGLTSSKSADFSQGLFNPNKLVSIEIQMAPADWEFVRTDGRNYSWKKNNSKHCTKSYSKKTELSAEHPKLN